jgi:signal peptidase I
MYKKALFRTFFIVSIFMLGFLASNIYAKMTMTVPTQIEKPSDDKTTDIVPSPNDWIQEKQILVYSQQIVLDLKDAQWATFTDTHSMEPVLSSRANAIEIVPESPDQIKVGDIVSYVSDYADGYIIHRVIYKGTDDDGVYFIMKGDNNPDPDPGRIRFDQIQRVVVAIVY